VQAALVVLRGVLSAAARTPVVQVIEAQVVDGPQSIADLFDGPLTQEQEIDLAEAMHESAKRYEAEHGSLEEANMADVVDVDEIEAALDATPEPEKRPAPLLSRRNPNRRRPKRHPNGSGSAGSSSPD
jgi:hypothetical protein